MPTVSNVSQVETAICASAEILRTLNDLFVRYAVPASTTESILRAWRELGAGLALAEPGKPIELEAVAAALEAHAEIVRAVRVATEKGAVPGELAAEVAAMLLDFGIGLRQLGHVGSA